MKWRRMAAGANGLWFPFFPLTRWDSYVNTWWDVLGCVFFRRCCGEGIHGWFAIRNLTHFSEPLVELRVVTIPGCWFFTCRTVQVLFRVLYHFEV